MSTGIKSSDAMIKQENREMTQKQNVMHKANQLSSNAQKQRIYIYIYIYIFFFCNEMAK
jgi:hypothetical protein